MSATGHEHQWVQGAAPHDLRCACGASLWAVQTMLDEAAADARRVAGEAHYTGCHVHQESETLELWLADAPPQVLAELEAIRPGVYVIHNDAPHALGELLALQESIDLHTLTSHGIKVSQIGPRNDGYIWVCVNSDLAAARAWFEAEYGTGWFRCYAPEPNTVAIVQLECQETGKSIDIFEYRSPGVVTANLFSTLITCPHCGGEHTWTSWYRDEAVMALQRSPDASRVLVETTEDGFSATALP